MAYNFQLHQMYYVASLRVNACKVAVLLKLSVAAGMNASAQALNPECVDSADRAGFFGCHLAWPRVEKHHEQASGHETVHCGASVAVRVPVLFPLRRHPGTTTAAGFGYSVRGQFPLLPTPVPVIPRTHLVR